MAEEAGLPHDRPPANSYKEVHRRAREVMQRVRKTFPGDAHQPTRDSKRLNELMILMVSERLAKGLRRR